MEIGCYWSSSKPMWLDVFTCESIWVHVPVHRCTWVCVCVCVPVTTEGSADSDVRDSRVKGSQSRSQKSDPQPECSSHDPRPSNLTPSPFFFLFPFPKAPVATPQSLPDTWHIKWDLTAQTYFWNRDYTDKWHSSRLSPETLHHMHVSSRILFLGLSTKARHKTKSQHTFCLQCLYY